MKIALLIPHSYKCFEKPFTKSLLSLIMTFERWNVREAGGKHELNVYIQDDGWIDFMRNRLTAGALKQGEELLLWLDTDMSFPSKMIQKMLKQFEDDPTLEAVTGLYTHKHPPFLPHVYTSFNEGTGKFNMAAGFPLQDVFEVAGAGFGCIMIKAAVFERMQEPWFTFEYGGAGEDLGFCRDAKMKMICDPTISCEHYLLSPYTIGHYVAHNELEVKDNVIEVSEDRANEIALDHFKK